MQPRATLHFGPLASRRDFLRDTLRAAGALAVGAATAGLPESSGAGRRRGGTGGIRGARNYGPLQAPDANGIRLPAGFASRVVAVSGNAVPGTAHVWHAQPDGGASFAMPDGGWVYASNSEVGGTAGGVGALRFDAAANLTDAYSILTGTRRNCAGGPTPWGTWLSCEEVGGGVVYECDPGQPSQGTSRDALGWFTHEGAAVDPFNGHVYLTEDLPDGLLYRFTADAFPDLSSGFLEAAEAVGPDPFALRPLVWHPIDDPNPGGGATPTRQQAPAATAFDGGEGIFYQNGKVYFTTKGDGRVWSIETFGQSLRLLYDQATSSNPILTNVDNVFVTPVWDVFVAEDPGDLQIVAIASNGNAYPVLQVTGQQMTEITGPALDPSGTRLYFSSQRGGANATGITYEVTGPFLD